MRIIFHKTFDKKFQKLNPKIKILFKQKLKVFLDFPSHPSLNNHALKGLNVGSRSINITGDIRAIYKIVSKDAVEFSTIDSHSNLYR
jgi:addiction module RelE/StbE family toxin